jgi:hypothetical protein
VKRGVTTRWSLNSGSTICMDEFIAERTGPSLPSGCTSQSLMAGYNCWESRLWRIRLSNRRHARCWNVSTNKTFWGSVTVFVPHVRICARGAVSNDRPYRNRRIKTIGNLSLIVEK